MTTSEVSGLDLPRPGETPPSFHVVAKPSGAACNIDCTYCFFLSKEALYPDGGQRMSDATLEAYIRQLLESHRTDDVTIAWQGGEPTLMGLDFFRRANELVAEYRRPNQRVQQTFQTNGIALDDAWCAFLKENRFLVGLSIDGPRELHDAYRVTRSGKGTFDLVLSGWHQLRDHQVDVNILCAVNAANQLHGRRIYRFFRDELGATWMQFIPIVERATPATIAVANAGWRPRPDAARLLYTQTGDLVTDRSVGSRQYGRFLIDIFEDWVRRDVGKVFVQQFDVTLEAHFGRHVLCAHAPTCGFCPALEYNGDLYVCDHYVEPGFRLGNIRERHMLGMVASPEMRKFGDDKRGALTKQCRACNVRPFCNGGCPKDRFLESRDGEPGQNYLCEGFYEFFSHVRPAMHVMASLLQHNQPPARVMEWMAAADAGRSRNDPCSCNSGRKFKKCHGRVQ
ncbi:MAG: anaerobic sulfatase maturase [Bradyrhizobiaceae bacterium]|nr:anaerobic sulfatase maturase [Bradyrhizobiaceae bacterium]